MFKFYHKFDFYLKLTCRHINRRYICFNIKSISVHPLLWMNVMLDFICMVVVGCEQRSVCIIDYDADNIDNNK